MGSQLVNAPEDLVDLGDSHSIQLRRFPGSPQDGYIGGEVNHLTPKGEQCQGWIPFDVPSNATLRPDRKWQVISWEPLTLSPSLLCACGDHGFIREGKWVPA